MIEPILYFLAYTIGVITIFLELICYNKKIEYLETILFTCAFLFFIISLSYSLFFDQHATESSSSNNLVLFSLVLLGLSTVLNAFAERQINVPSKVKSGFIMIGCLLILLILVNTLEYSDFYPEYLVYFFLVFSVLGSMFLVRKTKPEKRILHRESSERNIALFILIVIPVAILLEFLGTKYLGIESSKISIIPPIIFIILACSKLMDDINRLSLFTNINTIESQNAKNYNLTPRETEIAELLIKGSSYADISSSLFIAMPTVKSHVTNIYRKVQVKNKIELLHALKS